MKSYHMSVTGWLEIKANSPEDALKKYRDNIGKLVKVELVSNLDDEEQFKESEGLIKEE